jgi:hypothetical protein
MKKKILFTLIALVLSFFLVSSVTVENEEVIKEQTYTMIMLDKTANKIELDNGHYLSVNPHSGSLTKWSQSDSISIEFSDQISMWWDLKLTNTTLGTSIYAHQI